MLGYSCRYGSDLLHWSDDERIGQFEKKKRPFCTKHSTVSAHSPVCGHNQVSGRFAALSTRWQQTWQKSSTLPHERPNHAINCFDN